MKKVSTGKSQVSGILSHTDSCHNLVSPSFEDFQPVPVFVDFSSFVEWVAGQGRIVRYTVHTR